MRNFVALTVFLSVLVMSFGAAAKTQIEWMEWPRPNQDEFVSRLIASFEEQNPDIEVTYRPMASVDQVTVGMAAGASPDVIGYWGERLTSWMEAGVFLNLDPYLETYAFDWDDFNPMQLKAFEKDGNQYILPHYMGTGAMMYNKTRFDSAGLPLPDNTWTWQDRLEVGRKLTERIDDQIVHWGNMIPYTSLDVVSNLIAANGGKHHPDDDNSVVSWDTPEAIEAMDYWRIMLYDDESAPTPPQLDPGGFRVHFATDKASTKEALAIDLAHFTNVDFEIGVTQTVAGPAKRVTLATTDGYGIWAATPNPDAAARFLLHLTSPEANRLRAELQSLQPSRRSVLMEWVDITLRAFPFVSHSDVMEFYHAGEYAEPMPTWSEPETAYRLLNQAIHRIYYTNEPAALVMADVIPTLNMMLAKD